MTQVLMLNEQDVDYQQNGNNSLGKTTPADSFPDGVSPYGLHDMAGNVWELV